MIVLDFISALFKVESYLIYVCCAEIVKLHINSHASFEYEVETGEKPFLSFCATWHEQAVAFHCLLLSG